MSARQVRLLALGALASLGASAIAAAQQPGGGGKGAPVQAGAQARVTPVVHLQGVVVDDAQHGVPRAEVFWERGERETATRTDSSGRFSFGATGAGSYRISVRRMGYQPRVLFVDATAPAGEPPRIVLAAMPLGMDEIHVIAQSDAYAGKLDGFYDRKTKAKRYGQFYEESEIDRSGVWRLSELLRGIPGVSLQPSRRMGNVVRFRGCEPMIYLDGVRAPRVELDELIAPSDVAAIEVYVSPANTPAQFRDLMQPCGSIVVWAK